MKNFMKWALCSIVGLVLGVLLTIQHYAIKETIEERQQEKEEFATVKWRVKHYMLSDENLYNELIAQGVEFPEIVLAQAQRETGHYKSAVCKEFNNLFGLRKRDGSYMRFSHWTDAVTAYKRYIQKWSEKPPNYYVYLDNLGYAEDHRYIQKVKELVNNKK